MLKNNFMAPEEENLSEQETDVESAETGQETKEEETKLSPEQELVEVDQGLTAAKESILQVVGAIEQDTAAIHDVREKIGIPDSEDVPSSVAANSARKENLEGQVIDLEERKKELGGGDAPKTEAKSETEAGGIWVEPTPSEVTDAEFSSQKVRRFSAEQRADIKRHARSFNGVRYKTGDEVLVNGSLQTVVSFVETKDITEYTDPTTNEIVETLTPAVMKVRSASGAGEWLATEETDQAEPATGKAREFAAKRSQETADIDKKLFGGLFEGGGDEEDAGDQETDLRKAA